MQYRRLLQTDTTVPSVNGISTRDAYISDANFDNMAIILVALLCALIGALGLNSIVRCVLNCSRRFAMERLEQAAGKGLMKCELKQIPVAIYGGGVDIPATECAICLGEFAEGEKVRILPICNHGFHVTCIDTWLLSHSSCPNCRHSLLPNSPDNNAGGRQGTIAVAVGVIPS